MNRMKIKIKRLIKKTKLGIKKIRDENYGRTYY